MNVLSDAQKRGAMRTTDDSDTSCADLRVTTHKRRHAMRAQVGGRWQLRWEGLSGASVSCAVIDCSMGGLAVRATSALIADIDAHLLGQASLDVDGRFVCFVLLTLRHTAPATAPNATSRDAVHDMQAGLQVGFADARDKAAYQRAVRGALFANVHSGQHILRHVWEMLEAADYFSCGERRAQPTPLVRELYMSLRKQLTCAPHLGAQYLYQNEHGAIATLASFKPYSQTQVLHHLACMPDASDAQARRAIAQLCVCALEQALADSQTRCIAATIDDTFAPLASLVEAFVAHRRDSGHTAAFEADFYDVDALCDAHVPHDARLSLRQARTQDLRRISQAAERVRGGLYARAFDLTSQRLRGEAALGAWTQAGVLREREVMLACGAGQKPLVALVLDRVAPGADVLGALDTMLVVPLGAELTSPSVEPLMHLVLAYAKNWFLLRGAAQFFFADIDGIFAQTQPPGVVRRGHGAIWVVHRPLFGALQTAIDAHLSTAKKALPPQ